MSATTANPHASAGSSEHMVSVSYDDSSVRKFLLASVIWGVVGMTVGLLIAAQLAFFQLNFEIPWLTFSRLRPLHTNAVIFAFVGNMMFAGVYYSTQRLLKTRMASDALSKLHFYGWQLIIVCAALTLPFGYTQSKEYAELEWPIDLMVAVVWLAFGANFFWTLAKRREKHLYVAIWFYISTVITITVLYVVNNLALPIFTGLKSYSVYAGVQDALVQWWYGHNAVAFFLTTPILGIMYYFLPKAVDRPVYSYRLSIIHFWSLVFMYIWAGPHHLLYTALPDWAQSLGMLFSVMLWAPSWGGMLNGLLTLRGAWDKLRTDPVVKFFIAGVTFYGMATFEGPLLSIKSVSALGHYTDWIIGHVHSGALGWNGFMAAGLFYWLVPRLWGRQLHSKGAADFHFWMATLGILIYAISMWVSGITQGLMWRATNEDGALLYPSFVETLVAIRPMYMVRIVGGSMYLLGYVVMMWNLFKTIAAGSPVDTTVQVPAATHDLQAGEGNESEWSWKDIAFARPVILAVVGVVLSMAFFASNETVAVFAVVGLVGVVVVAWLSFALRVGPDGKLNFHRILEGRALIFSAFTLISILIGGIAELVPTIFVDKAVPATGAIAMPYQPLEVHGRDIYVREGCYTCHSQMVRPFRSEKLRYGDPSQASEFLYDHPFQWGSKRTGPDLHRVGGKYTNSWHYNHMMDPRSISDGSNMPAYPWMRDNKIDLSDTTVKMSALKTLGVPYSANDISLANQHLEEQAKAITADLKTQGIDIAWDSELVALIAYLQRLGKNVQPAEAGKAPVAQAAGAGNDSAAAPNGL